MNKAILAALAGAGFAALCSGTAANAVVVSTIGQQVQFTYNGFNNPDGAGGTIAGLSAKSIFTLTGISNGVFTFNYSIDNTSTVGSRVSIFGFDTTPDVLATGNSATGIYNTIALNGNVPNITGPDNFRICFSAGSNCAGGGGGGVFPADPVATGTFAVNFGAGVTSFNLTKAFVRYQSITGVQDITSATGLGTAVPEPAAWAMMLGGFGLMGVATRRRRRNVVTFA